MCVCILLGITKKVLLFIQEETQKSERRTDRSSKVKIVEQQGKLTLACLFEFVISCHMSSSGECAARV